MLFTAMLGLAAALASFWLLQWGSRMVSWRRFFAVTEVMLLLLAFSLLMTGLDRLSGLGILPFPSAPLWDSSVLLGDTSPLGSLLASLAGYRARPDAGQLAVALLYWTTVAYLLRTAGQRRQPKAA